MLQIAVIGAGEWGPNLIRNLHNRDKSVVAWVIDLDRGRLQQIAARFPEVKVSSDATDALGDSAVDGVVIATPTITHYELAKAALEAGKHVLVEKPIAAAATEAEELCLLASRGGLVLMVGHVFLYNDAVRRVKAYIDEREVGQIYYLSMVRTNLGPIRMDVNAAWDLAAHDISIANYWLGAEPLAAAAMGGSWINRGVEDAVFATLKYPNDVLVSLHASWLNPSKARFITVVGDRRMLTFDDMNLSEPIRIYDKYVSDERSRPGFVDSFASFRASVREGDVTIPKIGTGEPLRAECEHFLECIAEGKQPLSDGPAGASVVRVLEAISRSAGNAGREAKVAS